jgi:hypothetical protein
MPTTPTPPACDDHRRWAWHLLPAGELELGDLLHLHPSTTVVLEQGANDRLDVVEVVALASCVHDHTAQAWGASGELVAAGRTDWVEVERVYVERPRATTPQSELDHLRAIVARLQGAHADEEISDRLYQAIMTGH